MCKALIEGKLKNLLSGLEVKLASNTASIYFVGGSVTIADLQAGSITSPDNEYRPPLLYTSWITPAPPS